MDRQDGKPLDVLLADDDPDDRMFFTDALARIQARVSLNVVKDGNELMCLLVRDGFILPDVLFLDLNMPLKNGLECLEEIKADGRLKDLFVVVYSTSKNEREIEKAYTLGANIFINKPNTFSELKTILARVLEINMDDYYPNPEKEKFVFSV